MELFTKDASTSPNYSSNDLFKVERFPVAGEVRINEQTISCYLTNLDEESCFLMLKNQEDMNIIKLGNNVMLQITYENVTFQTLASCVSKYSNGFGFKFDYDEKNQRSLSGLYKVCLERGFYNF